MGLGPKLLGHFQDMSGTRQGPFPDHTFDVLSLDMPWLLEHVEPPNNHVPRLSHISYTWYMDVYDLKPWSSIPFHWFHWNHFNNGYIYIYKSLINGHPPIWVYNPPTMAHILSVFTALAPFSWKPMIFPYFPYPESIEFRTALPWCSSMGIRIWISRAVWVQL